MAGAAGIVHGDLRQTDQLAIRGPPQLHAFQQPSFDPAEYFNHTLPPLSSSSAARSQSSRSSSAVPLSELVSQTQALLTQLNAQTSRLSLTLTQLTDEILRTGSRLAYEVEVLRGDAIGLSDALEDTLSADIAKFLPGAKSEENKDNGQSSAEAVENGTDKATANVPPYMAQLKTLTLVRDRLDSVIKVFGDAMQWVLPPSELSIASSFISVSTPDQNADEANREQKGREFVENTRAEIEELMTKGGTDGSSGLDNAMSRIEALRVLTHVWKGTAEEKARLKMLDGLVRFAEERSRSL
ncbi:MAG: hypothetical protein M1821_002646 [Bathelium mastoideum]|nr:MAG: hypothetical protein M1821_002646 [Bathelium mastoideum]